MRELILIPEPRSCSRTDEELILCRETVIALESGTAEADNTWFCAQFLQEEICNATGFSPEIRVGTNAENEYTWENVIRFVSDTRLGGKYGQQYELRIMAGEVRLLAGTACGLFYAVQTLRQIIRQCGAVLPGLALSDEPDIPVRGFYHDVTRGRVPTLTSLKHLADVCAFYKLNQLQLYVEHSFLFRELGGLFADRDPLTAEEIRELDGYCRERHIDLVPSLSSFGHLYELLRTKQYSHLCELTVDPEAPFSFYDRMAHHTLDVSNPESEALMRRLILEYAALFGTDKFNICADETFDLGKGKNKEKAEKEGTAELYTGFLQKLCRIVKETGKTPMFWGDILKEFPEKMQELPEDTVCLYWNYEPDVRETDIRRLTKAGIKRLYCCPGVHGWNHLINRYDHAYNNIVGMCRLAGSYHAEGVLITDWGDYGHVNHPDFSVPGLIYGAAFSWRTPQEADVVPDSSAEKQGQTVTVKGMKAGKEEMDRRISLIEYGDTSGTVMDCLNRLSEMEAVTWGQIVCLKENRIWDQFVPKQDSEYGQKACKAAAAAYDLLGKLPEKSRPRLAAYLLAAEGQRLLNQAWACLQTSESVNCPAADVACRLRYWYRDYQKLWRSVSKESELFRIGEVINWCVERLEERCR